MSTKSVHHKDEGTDARDASPFTQSNQHADCDQPADDVKWYATLAAKLALAGFSLNCLDDGRYIVTRWNLARYLTSLEAVQEFLRKVAP